MWPPLPLGGEENGLYSVFFILRRHSARDAKSEEIQFFGGFMADPDEKTGKFL